jgi:hypothetical protein
MRQCIGLNVRLGFLHEMDRSTEDAAQTSVLEFELFPAVSIVNDGQCLVAETSNIRIRDNRYHGV